MHDVDCHEFSSIPSQAEIHVRKAAIAFFKMVDCLDTIIKYSMSTT